MGSSMVTMWRACEALMWSIIAAAVVVLPEAAGPEMTTSPSRDSARSATTLGTPRSAMAGAPGTTRRMARLTEPRWR